MHRGLNLTALRVLCRLRGNEISVNERHFRLICRQHQCSGITLVITQHHALTIQQERDIVCIKRLQCDTVRHLHQRHRELLCAV